MLLAVVVVVVGVVVADCECSFDSIKLGELAKLLLVDDLFESVTIDEYAEDEDDDDDDEMLVSSSESCIRTRLRFGGCSLFSITILFLIKKIYM